MQACRNDGRCKELALWGLQWVVGHGQADRRCCRRGGQGPEVWGLWWSVGAGSDGQPVLLVRHGLGVLGGGQRAAGARAGDWQPNGILGIPLGFAPPGVNAVFLVSVRTARPTSHPHPCRQAVHELVGCVPGARRWLLLAAAAGSGVAHLVPLQPVDRQLLAASHNGATEAEVEGMIQAEANMEARDEVGEDVLQL